MFNRYSGIQSSIQLIMNERHLNTCCGMCLYSALFVFVFQSECRCLLISPIDRLPICFVFRNNSVFNLLSVDNFSA